MVEEGEGSDDAEKGFADRVTVLGCGLRVRNGVGDGGGFKFRVGDEFTEGDEEVAEEVKINEVGESRLQLVGVWWVRMGEY